jgi:tRNA(fMet)-specific endonuclease VapC
MKYLLDTNVILELVSKNADPKVLNWIDSIEPENIFLSSMIIGELCSGIEKLPESKKKATLVQWLHNDLLLRFGNRVLSPDAEAMLAWGKMTAILEKKGRVLPAIDSIIAALALHHKCILVTKNAEGFNGTGVTIYNPWKGNK